MNLEQELNHSIAQHQVDDKVHLVALAPIELMSLVMLSPISVP